MTRTITTTEELDALPVGTVIRVADHYWHDGTFGFAGTVMPREEEGWLFDNCCGILMPSSEIDLPVTVLYVPGEQLRPIPTRDELAEAIYLNRLDRIRTPDDWEDLDNLDRKVWRIYADAALELLTTLTRKK